MFLNLFLILFSTEEYEYLRVELLHLCDNVEVLNGYTNIDGGSIASLALPNAF